MPPAPRPKAGAATLAAQVPVPDAALVALVISAFVLYVDEGRALGLLGGTARGHPAVATACELIQRRLHERLTLRDMAEAAHVASPYLVQLFHHELGVTPIRYLWSQRVHFGIHLLQDTGLPVHEVAAMAGFQTSYHFSRLVRAATGLPPREVRRRSWGTSQRFEA